ncbi:hypothetical protein HK100_007501 [Physocladia obscura]|uniref:Peroxin-5 n=1 Tax=Physocladia obscura TaxID=109957 RepID=A0AAD5XIP2_9FUNG|nr:hypothetical protein HK100_007501 [Physocladia obscura]
MDSSASCSTSNSNALKNLVQHSVSSSVSPFTAQLGERSNLGSSGERLVGRNTQLNISNDAAAFFAQNRAQQSKIPMAQTPFEFSQMRKELIVSPPLTLHQSNNMQQRSVNIENMNISDEFSQFGMLDEFPIQPLQSIPQFRGIANNSAAISSLVPANPLDDAFFERAFDKASSSITATTPTYIQDQQDLTAEFTATTSPEQQQQPAVDIQGQNAASLLAQSAAHLVATVETSAGATNSKFANSKFMEFMKQIRDGEVGIENNKVVEMARDGQGAPIATAAKQPTVLSTSDDWVKNVGAGLNGSSGWYYDDGAGYAGLELTAEQQKPYEWRSEFVHYGEPAGVEADSPQQTRQENQDTEDYPMIEESFKEFFDVTGTGPSAMSAAPSNPAIEKARLKEWHDLEQSWNTNIDQNAVAEMLRRQQEQQDISHNYDFIMANPYVRNVPLSQLKDISRHANLTDSILSLEAAAQIDPLDATSWKNLGLRQQENENENAAISALRNATKLDPSLLDSWIALSVSYTNENMFSEAYKALESWIANNPKYSHLLSSSASASVTNHHEYLANLYIAAARTNSDSTKLDAGVQMALGVLFNISGEHSKAVDCFAACLKIHPQDYMLWNKLGATLANSKDPRKALEAYGRALELNPGFLRARYNVAIAFVQLGNYSDAARQLVAVLEAQEENVKSVVEGGVEVNGDYEKMVLQMHSLSSASAWNTLWMIMDRYCKFHISCL